MRNPRVGGVRGMSRASSARDEFITTHTINRRH